MVKTSNLVAVFGAVSLGVIALGHFQCSARQDIQDRVKTSQQSHAARLDCAINPETCPAPSR